MALEQEKDVEEESTSFFYIWEENKIIFDLFKLLMPFLTEYNGIDTAVMLRLIDEDKLPLKRTLLEIAYLHSGYSEVLLPKVKKDGG